MCVNKWLILELLVLNNNIQNYLSICKQISSNNSFKNKVTYKLFAYNLIYD